jgi:formylglycine-generating enzyme required for sulfatase activity
VHLVKVAAPLALAVTCMPARVAGQAVVPDSLPQQRLRWELVEVPAGPAILRREGRTDTVHVERFLMWRTEVPWDLFDVFYLRQDVPRAMRDSVDARTRPSRPYGAPDRGFGHRGYPVISVSHGAAVRFATWLSERTGHRYAVPTDAQWQRAADLALADGTALSVRAVVAENAGGTTQPVGSRAPDALGLHDLFGNAAEWVTDEKGNAWLRGGAFTDSLVAVGASARAAQRPAWNANDPQVPKSRWWLSDAPFAGIRLVRIP